MRTSYLVSSSVFLMTILLVNPSPLRADPPSPPTPTLPNTATPTTTPGSSNPQPTLTTVPPLSNEVPCLVKFDPSCSNISRVLAGITDWLIAIGGTLFFFMFLWAGLKYLTAGGAEQESHNAKQTMLFAVIGLVITLAAWAVLKFLLGELL